MKNLLVAGIGFFAFTSFTPAYAADLPAKAPAPVTYDWTGLYTGLGLGGRSDTVSSTVNSVLLGTPPVSQNTPANCLFAEGPPGCPNGATLDRAAFRGTFYAGYNWQWSPQWLFGIEGDVGSARKTRTSTGPYPGTVLLNPLGAGAFLLGQTAADSFAVQTTWDASLRLRAGYLFNPQVLLYVTGGPEWLHINQTSTCSSATAGNLNWTCAAFNPAGTGILTPLSITDSTTRLGWTIGGGLEAKLAPQWIARGEVRYASFGTINNADTRTTAAGAALNPLVVNYSSKVQEYMATIGISYLWGGPRL